MIVQIAIGSVLIVISILIATASYWVLEHRMSAMGHWLAREPHRAKLMVVIGVLALWVLALVTVGVWLWALAFYWLGIFETLELSVYFSLVAFTTLGFGDVLLPFEWRLLAGLSATNGLLNIGLLTAILIDTLRYVRKLQRDYSKDRLRAEKARHRASVSGHASH